MKCSEEKKALTRLEEAGTAGALKIEYSGLKDDGFPVAGLKEQLR